VSRRHSRDDPDFRSRSRLLRRLERIDWTAAAASLEARGYARLPGLLGARECTGLIRLWEKEDRFRSQVDMERHGFGRGVYRYLAAPLPEPVASLRELLYPPLALIANRWQQRLGLAERFPGKLGDFLHRCGQAGQQQPTPLLLRYQAGDFNRLHQDRYGAVAFPLQVAILLSHPAVEFEGGEFLLVEQRPRLQARGTAVALARGEGLIFPNQTRPVDGRRGVSRLQVRHGVSELQWGLRMTLGLIFHDAR